MKEIGGGVCAAKGFKAGGVRCGIKASAKKRDLALIYSETVCAAAGVFTTNRVKAACILVSQENLKGGALRAIIANSGNANACTGEAGIAASRRMTELAAEVLAIEPAEVAVASTGVIGVPLPIAVIESGIAALGNSLSADEGGHAAALEAIMTTDTRPKDCAVEVEIGGKPVRIGGMIKGAGMIHPNMATLLCFITTDAAIDSTVLDSCLRNSARRSFNRITVDGDTSTNDAAIIMANGLAGNPPITAAGAEREVFERALEALCVKLARAAARDGEGATKLLTVAVSGAKNEDTAEALAKAVASSSLVKAACFGEDANWGRILCAMGYSGAEFDPAAVDISFTNGDGTRSGAGSGGEEAVVCQGGASVPFSEETAKRILSRENIEIRIKAGAGAGAATAWGCDLTFDYVKINGSYRT
ncbi:MAG: bifunctional glutamate N-acetyltransferase/amino-acid acetyltransferase ArgJ [Treponema sp.]|nr:bifunctional glutamate N-acetyltransferase/amino-acid acetyltransferase ArgJ [Treponema sp.]